MPYRQPSAETGGDSPAQAAPAGRSGLRLGSIFGVELYMDWSLAVIFGLIAFSLALGVFPAWHPEWSAATSWTVSLLASVLFFASIAAHELSHALVGRRQGIPVRRITLFLFGGMAHMEGEAPNPRAELLMAAVGPLTSAVIGVIASWIGLALAGGGASAAEVVAGAGPVATLLLWLGPINVLLALFNLVPGFPLDGGRVLRALLWYATGDLRKATRYASFGGQAVAWLLIATGLFMIVGYRVPIFGTGVVSGLWLVLIGWFLYNAARFGYKQLVVRQALEDVPVRALMRRQVQSVPSSLSLEEVVQDYFMAHDDSAFPVERGGQLAGLITLEDVRSVSRSEWPVTRVSDVMTPASKLSILRPDAPAFDAFVELGRLNQLPVVGEGGEISGMVGRDDLVKWLSLRDRGAV